MIKSVGIEHQKFCVKETKMQTIKRLHLVFS